MTAVTPYRERCTEQAGSCKLWEMVNKLVTKQSFTRANTTFKAMPVETLINPRDKQPGMQCFVFREPNEQTAQCK